MDTFDGIIPQPTDYIAKQHIMRYVFASHLVQDKTVLDIGCGAGYGSHYLACRADTVVGVDVSLHAVTYAKKNYVKKNLYFLQGNALHLPFETNSFDVVASFETIEHIREYKNYVKEMKRVLTPGGIFICSTPHINYTRHPLYHVKEFYPEEFFQVLKMCFDHVEEYGQFISVITRLKDVIRLKEKCYTVKKVLLSSYPGKEVLRTLFKKSVSTPVPELIPYKISDRDAAAFDVHQVKVLTCKKSFELVRIMVAVCK